MDSKEKEDFKKELVEEYLIIKRSRWYYLLSGAVAVVVIAFGFGIKGVLDYVGTESAKSTEDHLKAIVTEAEAYRLKMLDGLPAGAIVAWNSKDKVPNGWVICDGKNGTPDLTNRFIMGTVISEDIGKTGGQATHKHDAQFIGSRFEATNQGSNGTGATRHDDTRVEILPADNIPPFVKLVYIMNLK